MQNPTQEPFSRTRQAHKLEQAGFTPKQVEGLNAFMANLVTKDELRQILKQELAGFCTCEDMQRMSARVEKIEANMVTKADLMKYQILLNSDLDRRFDGTKSDIDGKFDKMRSDMDEKFGDMDRKFDKMRSDMDERFGDMDRRFGEMRRDMDEKFDKMRSDMDKRFSKMRSDMDEKFDRLRSDIDKKFDQLKFWIPVTMLGLIGAMAGVLMIVMQVMA